MAWLLCLALACGWGGAPPPDAVLAIDDVTLWDGTAAAPAPHRTVIVRGVVGAGMPPAEALLAATRDPARALDLEDEIGTVRPGLVADLVLLGADPLADIENTRAIEAVVIRGRLVRRAELDSILGE
jgi:adenine deaminase